MTEELKKLEARVAELEKRNGISIIELPKELPALFGDWVEYSNRAWRVTYGPDSEGDYLLVHLSQDGWIQTEFAQRHEFRLLDNK